VVCGIGGAGGTVGGLGGPDGVATLARLAAAGGGVEGGLDGGGAEGEVRLAGELEERRAEEGILSFRCCRQPHRLAAERENPRNLGGPR
jgi:hypothetical protein